MRKYDVAISVAEEDKEVAKAIVAELKKLKVRYYYYEELAARSWGKYVMHLTMDAYGKNTRYVLLITSETFVNKYWANIERQVALSQLQRGNILQLRLDTTSVDGISQHVVYQDWKGDPKAIALILYDMIMWKRRWELIKWGVMIMLLSLVFIMAYLGIERRGDINEEPLKEEKILVQHPHYPFYISNVEVTVAAYREYCMETDKVLPEQPVSSTDSMPVRNVTWEEAEAYCEYRGGRLPTSVEWEYAAEAGRSFIYSGGTSAIYLAVYNKVKPAKVGSKRPNKWKIYDMTGNVAEWCSDWADSTRTMKVVKGGGYLSSISPVNELAVNYKRAEQPEKRMRDVGFRVVWDNKK